MITLELTIEEVNKILQALATQPYSQVVELISKIQEQGNKQIQDNGSKEDK